MSRFKRIIFIIMRRAHSIPALARANPPIDLSTGANVRALESGGCGRVCVSPWSWILPCFCVQILQRLELRWARGGIPSLRPVICRPVTSHPGNRLPQVPHLQPTSLCKTRVFNSSQGKIQATVAVGWGRPPTPAEGQRGLWRRKSWRLGRLRSLHSPARTGILFQGSRKWCYCEWVLTLCRSEFQC